MKANELMIGDWMIGGSGEPFKIGIIDPDFLYWNEVQPIPLTPEILERNGFVDERSNYAYRTDNYHVCYYCADEILSINKYGAILDVYCFYVHQLQHALRLCGIDKEIVL